MEQWKEIDEFPDYSVSDHGRVRRNKNQRLVASYPNQFNVACVGLVRDRVQYNRSLALLVARAFIPQLNGAFDTPINLDGNRDNNCTGNLVWRPRWFAVEYNRQFSHPYHNRIHARIRDIRTKETYNGSFEAATMNGLLEADIVLTMLNRTFTWPTFQEFYVVE